MQLNRRQFIALGTGATAAFALGNGRAGRIPPEDRPFRVIVPDFMHAHLEPRHLDYLNTTIPALYHDHADLFPVLGVLPAVVVLNTLKETLIYYGGTLLAPEVLGDEALTLVEAQHLLRTTRFGSVATPHRGDDPAKFGKLMYIKQHPEMGYMTPEDLLLEELLHVQQDITIMRHIIMAEDLPPKDCLHAHLKGISELGAHVITDEMRGGADYLFLLDDGTMCETAVEALGLLAGRLNTDSDRLARALLYDVEAYVALDAVAVANHERHIWEMVTTWRHSRDENGDATGIAPAFVAYEEDGGY